MLDVIMASAAGLPVVQPTRIMPNSPLSQVLQSDPVRRLFNQPNIVIHAIPRNNSPTAFRMVKQKLFTDKKNGVNGEYQLPNKPEVSIQVINMPNKETPETETLLPSKNNGKSEILLVPIVRKRKPCGHFEPCESLVCNVDVQQYENNEGVTPLISINISKDEIDASVTKHCQNKNCDALSIDHDCCRRASIQLYRSDKCTMCDICEIKFQTRKARLNHKKCRRKHVYQYNNATPSEVFKFRMRERELQILEAARLKRTSDYLDPVTGFSRTMEALTKNDELIIIPKIPPIQPKALKPMFTPISNSNSTFNNINTSNNSSNHINNNSNIAINKNNNNNNSIKSILGSRKMQTSGTDKELTSEMISNIILSCQNSINMSNRNDKSVSTAAKEIKLSDHLNGATVSIREPTTQPNHQCINVTALKSNTINSLPVKHQQPLLVGKESPANNIDLKLPKAQQNANVTGTQNNLTKESVKPVNLNNWILPNQPLITPFKVVPIAELKSEPSLLHQTQGVPKFCVVPDTSAMPQVVTKLKKPAQKKKLIQVHKKQTQLLPKLLPKTVQVINSSKFRPLQPALAGTPRNVEVKLGGALLSKKQKSRKRPRKKLMRKGKFRCTHCPKRFSSIDYCRLHIAKHENNPGFFCRLCEKGFVNKYIMKKHMDTDHKTDEVRCEVCNNILPSLQELLKHMKTSDTKVKQQCSECSESFSSCNSLDIHMKKNHGFLICSLCKCQVTKSKMKKHLMLEHSISKSRSESGFEKLCYIPSENEKVNELAELISEVSAKAETIVKVELVKENKIETDCIARNRSVRRRSSKEFFICTVCERRFENEKQYQIHLANNPLKFTPCLDCGKKFHRKSEYTEHSKSCQRNPVQIVEQTPKKRKSSVTNDEIILKNGRDSLSQNSIDQKQKEILDTNKCKKIKLNEMKIVQKKEDESNLKNTIKIKNINGLEQVTDSSDCLNLLKVKKTEKNEHYDVIKHENKNVLVFKVKQTQKKSSASAVLDKSIAMTNIIQDHNYQALQ